MEDGVVMFAIRNLSVLNYAQGYTSWHYRARADSGSEAAQKDVLAPDFFEQARDMLEAGDTVLCSCSDGGVLLYVHTSGTSSVKVEAMCRTSENKEPAK
jgi:hypothetical protein